MHFLSKILGHSWLLSSEHILSIVDVLLTNTTVSGKFHALQVTFGQIHQFLCQERDFLHGSCQVCWCQIKTSTVFTDFFLEKKKSKRSKYRQQYLNSTALGKI